MDIQQKKQECDQKLQDIRSTVGAKFFEIFCVLGQLLLFILRLIYYLGQSLYKELTPKTKTSLKGEIVLITGTGHGIGKELALAYAAKGTTVIGWDINTQNNDETFKEIAKLGFKQAYSFKCDITNRDEVLKVAKEVAEKVGNVTILINNAGIMPCHLLEEHTPQEIEKIINLNLTAHFWLLEAFLPSMKQNNHGHIVSISSLAGMIGFPNLIPYCASKFAVRGYMEALHEELRAYNPNHKIKLTIIYPYMVDTGLCKRPNIKYKSLMPLVSPKQAAKEILDAQVKGKMETSIPAYMNTLILLGRMLPIKAAMDLKDTFNASVDSDL